jgi:hypothetical protein
MKKVLFGIMTAALLAGVLIACTPASSGDTTPPTVSTTAPLASATGVAGSSVVSAIFSEAMDVATIIGANFKLATGTTPVSGTVTYDVASMTATFAPAANFAGGTPYTATITTGVKDSAGNAMAADKVWTFNTATLTKAGPAPLVLGRAASFAILAKVAITNTDIPTHLTAVIGDVGLSPADNTFVGFVLAPNMPGNYPGSFYASTPNVTGAGLFSSPNYVFAAVYTADMAAESAVGAGTTAANLLLAVTSMANALTATPVPPTVDHTNLLAGIIPAGTSLAPGYYTWTTGVQITGNIILTGGGGTDDVWIFNMAQDLLVDSGVVVTLAGGAQAKNVFWRITGGSAGATLGTNSDFQGSILSKYQIIMQTGSKLTGRALAETQVTLDQATVTQP